MVSSTHHQSNHAHKSFLYSKVSLPRACCVIDWERIIIEVDMYELGLSPVSLSMTIFNHSNVKVLWA